VLNKGIWNVQSIVLGGSGVADGVTEGTTAEGVTVVEGITVVEGVTMVEL